MNQLTTKFDATTGESNGTRLPAARSLMDRLAGVLVRLGILTEKWWAYEAERLIPYISNGPLIFWLYPAFGMRGATWFLGVSEWTFGTLLFLGFWNKRLGVLGALGSCATFIGTVTIIPFMPDGWDASAGGFPGHDRQRPFPYEGYRSFDRIVLFTESGRSKSITCHQAKS
jgi:uncharacterized membrane protein YkgB